MSFAALDSDGAIIMSQVSLKLDDDSCTFLGKNCFKSSLELDDCIVREDD